LETAVDQRLFFCGGAGFRRLGEEYGGRIQIGEGRGIGEWGGVVEDLLPVVEFVGEREFFFYVGEAREHNLAEIGEDGGFARRDAVLGNGGEEFAEDVVDVGGGEEIAVERSGNFVAETLGLEELELLPGVEGTEDGMSRGAQHAAEAAVGEVKLALGGDADIRILVRHGSLLEMDLN
jgi:hypothetical protein